jgi:hypothetical protein
LLPYGTEWIPLDDASMSKKEKDKISKTQAFIAVKKEGKSN